MRKNFRTIPGFGGFYKLSPENVVWAEPRLSRSGQTVGACFIYPNAGYFKLRDLKGKVRRISIERLRLLCGIDKPKALPNETFRPVPGFDRYEFSSHDRLWQKPYFNASGQLRGGHFMTATKGPNSVNPSFYMESDAQKKSLSTPSLRKLCGFEEPPCS